MTLVEMRARLRERLLESGNAEFLCTDSATAEALREAAYRWARERNYMVTTANKPIDGEPLKRRFTAKVIKEER